MILDTTQNRNSTAVAGPLTGLHETGSRPTDNARIPSEVTYLCAVNGLHPVIEGAQLPYPGDKLASPPHISYSRKIVFGDISDTQVRSLDLQLQRLLCA